MKHTTLLILLLIVAVVWILARMMCIARQRRASAEKINFFINSAHDIRTPLTLIKAPLEELCRTESFTPLGAENMSVAMRNVDNLLRLTANLMNFEHASLYSDCLCKSCVELGSYVRRLLQPFSAYAAAKGVSLNFDDRSRGASAWMDVDKMDSVVKNLLSNAVKYTPQGGTVSVVLTDSCDSWGLEVTDTGIGIPSGERRKLFCLYYRASNVVNSSITGSGVGLMLVKRLVEMHCGRITLRSKVGRGTSVRLTIPKHSKALSRAKVVYHVPTTESSACTDVVVSDGVGGLPPTSADCRQRLLIAEDNDDLRNYLKRALRADYDVRLCNNGKEALTEICEYKPDMIISDIMMPEMRGDELCKLVKSNIETSHIPVILLTALGSEEDMLHGLSLKADAYISKPFSMELLRGSIASILANRRMLWQKYSAGYGAEMSRSDVDRLAEIDRHFVDDVRRHVDNHLSNQNLSVDTLCGLLNMSRTSFYNKMKSLTGMAPADFVRTMRLTRAAELLSVGGYSVTEVAEMTGFNDAKYFREVFKRHCGQSPLQYAREHQSGQGMGRRKQCNEQ